MELTGVDASPGLTWVAALFFGLTPFRPVRANRPGETMSTPYPPNPNSPQHPGQPNHPPQPGQPGQPGHHAGPSGPSGQPTGAGYGGYPSYGQPPQSSPPTQPWNQPPPPSAPWGPSGGAPHGNATNKSFFAKLFDLSFSEFVTPSVVKIVYILAMIGVGFLWLGLSIAAFQTSAVFGIVVLLVLGPLYALFLLIITRITFEFYVAVIRIAEDVREIKMGESRTGR